MTCFSSSLTLFKVRHSPVSPERLDDSGSCSHRPHSNSRDTWLSFPCWIPSTIPCCLPNTDPLPCTQVHLWLALLFSASAHFISFALPSWLRPWIKAYFSELISNVASFWRLLLLYSPIWISQTSEVPAVPSKATYLILCHSMRGQRWLDYGCFC